MHTYVIMYVAIVCKQRSPTFANDHRSICELAREKGEPTKMHHLMMCVSRRGQKKKKMRQKQVLWTMAYAYRIFALQNYAIHNGAHSTFDVVYFVVDYYAMLLCDRFKHFRLCSKSETCKSQSIVMNASAARTPNQSYSTTFSISFHQLCAAHPITIFEDGWTNNSMFG